MARSKARGDGARSATGARNPKARSGEARADLRAVRAASGEAAEDRTASAHATSLTADVRAPSTNATGEAAPEGGRASWARRAQLVGVVVATGLFVGHALLLDARLQDDAFISFRYARNLAEGRGLVWNPGERVEGYTNFLWTLIFAAAFRAVPALDPVPLARALAIAAGCAAIAATFAMVRRAAPDARLLPLVPPILLAGNWAFAVNAMSGLETTPFAALVTIATALVVRETDDLRPRGASVAYALAALTRPEAIGLFALTAASTLAGIRRAPPAARRRYAAWLLLPFGAIVGAHAAFRLAYYGSIVPNTFVAKAGRPLPAGMGDAWSYLGGFVWKSMDFAGAFTALALVFAVSTRARAAGRAIALAATFGVVNVAVSGADFMIGHRFLVPYLPAIYVAAALGAARLVERYRKAGKGSGIELELGLAILAGFACARWLLYARDRVRPFEELRRRVAIDANAAAGDWLREHLPESATVVTLDVGELGYRSGLRVIDLSGLTDAEIARLPGDVLDKRIDADALLDRDPDAIVLVSRSPGKPGGLLRGRGAGPYWPPGSSRALLESPRLQRGFELAARFPAYERARRDESGRWVPVPAGSRAPGAVPITYFLEVYRKRAPGDADPE